jgi:hypothetical protein
MTSFQQAFEQLLRRAPGPVFPKARRLYLHKYALEAPAAPTPGDGGPPFRTFLLEEEIQEGEAGLLRIRALAFALVHWQAPQTDLESYRRYLQQRWELDPAALELQAEPWFRQGGAWARFTAPAVVERVVVLPLVTPPADPASAADGADPSR